MPYTRIFWRRWLDSVRRYVAKPHDHLTADDVAEIRFGLWTVSEAADRFDLSRITVADIRWYRLYPPSPVDDDMGAPFPARRKRSSKFDPGPGRFH